MTRMTDNEPFRQIFNKTIKKYGKFEKLKNKKKNL